MITFYLPKHRESVKHEIREEDLIDFCENNFDKIDWLNLVSEQKLNENFIRHFLHKLNGQLLCSKQQLSESFIREFDNQLSWQMISIYQKLSEDFMREFKDKIHWEFIAYHQTLSEDFIREFQGYGFDWHHLPIEQTFSESFIEEFQFRLPKNMIEKFQNVSPQFAKKIGLNLEYILKNNANLSTRNKKKFEDYLSIHQLFSK